MIETSLAARVLDALLREDFGGLRQVIGDARRPRPRTLDAVFQAVRLAADPRDDVAAFERECTEALATERLHSAVHSEVLDRLGALWRGDRFADVGPGTFYDTLAAYTDHPVHPAGRCRLGLSETDLRRYAPEFHPVFPLRWASVPRAHLTVAGERPRWWPAPEDVGLPGQPDRDLIPVHPLTAGVLTGRREPVILGPDPYLEVQPTLSMRTVCVVADPPTHLKVPLPISTLGLRNRRTIMPRTLVDGALVQRVLGRLLDREPDLPVLLADEQTYGHAGDPFLGYLVRRFPAATADARVVPVAGLLARAPGGRYVIEELTGDVEGFLDRYLRALFDWNVTLFVRYGIALEAHQQNVSVVLRPGSLDLLVKDNDSPLVDRGRLSGALGVDFRPADERLLTSDPEALAKVFITITLHLCAGAIAFGLADRGLLPLATGLGLIRDRLDEALRAFGSGSAFLRARTLDAETLPVKAMLTASTLVDKARTGATDINKYYGPPGPNYLRGHIQ